MAVSLRSVHRLFLDSAPVIYYVEQHPAYHSLLQSVFARLDAGDLEAVTSPITLAECLIFPVRSGNAVVTEAFVELLGGRHSVDFVPLGRETAKVAAQIRSKYNVTLTDAFQVAAALEGTCEAMLTNDKELVKISDLRIVLVEDLRD